MSKIIITKLEPKPVTERIKASADYGSFKIEAQSFDGKYWDVACVSSNDDILQGFFHYSIRHIVQLRPLVNAEVYKAMADFNNQLRHHGYSTNSEKEYNL